MLENLKQLQSEQANIWSAQLLTHAAKRGYEDVMSTRSTIERARPHDVLTSNSIRYMTYGISKKEVLLPLLHERLTNVRAYKQESEKKITKFASSHIKKGSVIATYGHSPLVYETLHASEGKNFTVHVIDSSGSGRILTKLLSQRKIKVVYFEENAARFAVKNADVLFLGGHTLTNQGHVVAPMGSELVAESALLHHCKVFVLCHGWKFDINNVFSKKEYEGVSWKNAPKKVTVNRYVFETLNDESFTAVITEVGVHHPGCVVKELRSSYPWMKKNWFS